MSLLGERLRQTREARGLTLLQVEIDTRIRTNVVDALERGDYANLPPDPFLRGLVRTYAAYLGLDSEEMLALYHADRVPPPAEPPQHISLPTPSPAPPTTPAESPTAAPVRKPTPVTLPSKLPLPRPPLLKPRMPEPPAPPETLEEVETAPGTRAHSTRRPAPLPMTLAIAAAIILLCLVIAFAVTAQLAPMLSSLVSVPATPTRLLPTRTPTLRPGAAPTPIPTIPATAPPFATFPGNPTPTVGVTPRRTLDTFAGLYLNVEVTQTITLQVGVDGVMVFSGQMQPGTTRAWNARESLYVRVENPRGAILELNGSSRPFAARNFAETRVIERMWTLNPKGTPISAPPAPPPTLTPFAPTPTRTPFS